jgi:hypothetical protein
MRMSRLDIGINPATNFPPQADEWFSFAAACPVECVAYSSGVSAANGKN